MNLYFRMLLLWLRNRRMERTSVWDTVTTPFRVTPGDLDVLLHTTAATSPSWTSAGWT